jgi:hypothetical protein
MAAPSPTSARGSWALRANPLEADYPRVGLMRLHARAPHAALSM